MPSISTVFAALAASTLLISAEAKACPPLGAVLPPPQRPSKSEDVQKAFQKLNGGLDAFSSAFKASGFSVGVKSLHEDKQLYGYHHTPEVKTDFGTDKIDENTIYRVGSISKLVTALIAVQNTKINLEDSVLKYIPELEDKDQNDAIMDYSWEDITVGSLTNHLSGIANNMAMDLAILPKDWAAKGLPQIKKGDGPGCSGLPNTKSCTSKDIIDDINGRPPVFNSYNEAAYSNVAFALLGMVIEAATGDKFEDVVNESIYKPAGMKSSSFNGFPSSFKKNGFVPIQEPTWNITAGVFEFAGGMFSNTVDLLAFAEGILNNRFLSPRETRQWMKPAVHTSSWGFSIGGPWEILRSDNITTDGRLIDVYTKTGDLGTYHGILGIVPDYDIVISVLTGGVEVTMDAHARAKIFSAIVSNLLPALEQAGKDEVAAAEGYVGTFTDEDTNSTITLEIDDGPGLVISEFHVRGYDVLTNIGSYSISTSETGAEKDKKLPKVEGRMYPTKTGESKKNIIGGVGWRAMFDAKTDEQKAELDAQLFYKDGSCESWVTVDGASSYNFLSLAEFVFWRNKDGNVYSIENPAFNVTMAKVSGSNEGRDGRGTGSGKDSQNGQSKEDGEEEGGDANEAEAPGSSASTLRLAGPTAVLAAVFGTILIALQL